MPHHSSKKSMHRDKVKIKSHSHCVLVAAVNQVVEARIAFSAAAVSMAPVLLSPSLVIFRLLLYYHVHDKLLTRLLWLQGDSSSAAVANEEG